MDSVALSNDVLFVAMVTFIWKIQYEICNIIYLYRGEIFEDKIGDSSYVHNMSSCEIKAWKKFRLERDTSAVLYQLGYQAIKVTLWVCRTVVSKKVVSQQRKRARDNAD